MLVRFASVSLTFIFVMVPWSTVIYTLSLHDALPICHQLGHLGHLHDARGVQPDGRPEDHRHHDVRQAGARQDRKSTRLNSSHTVISYAVFCLKKKIMD